jgi:hypothetical protein
MMIFSSFLIENKSFAGFLGGSKKRLRGKPAETAWHGNCCGAIK